MLRKQRAGEYQIGIYAVTRLGRKWESRAVGPGTIGDGSPRTHPTLRAAYLELTGEPMEYTRANR